MIWLLLRVRSRLAVQRKKFEPPKAYGPDGKELTRDAYIEMFGENLIYNLGDCQINFYVEEGKVSSIVYQNNKNHDKFSWS